MRLLPRPVQSRMSGETAHFTPPIAVVGGKALEWQRPLAALKAGLQDMSIPTKGTAQDTDNTIVLAAGPQDHPLIAQAGSAVGADASQVAAAFRDAGEQGYLLGVLEIGTRTVAVLGASTERGLFHAVQTLLQMLRTARAPNRLPQGILIDSPSFAWRGIVEGFYGPPWTHEQRLRLLDFMGAYKMNVFMYAPKDDPFHRERWREPYPDKQAKRLGELIDRAAAQMADFCFAISPGLSMRYSSDADFQHLAQKCDAVLDMGATWIGLFLDDIPDQLQHPEDRERFPTLGQAHAHLATRLWEHLQARNSQSRMILCPTRYIGIASTPYLEDLGKGTPEQVFIMWTGRDVCSAEIPTSEADGFGAGIKRKPFVWDNYPVNDYDRNRLLVGPLRARPADLHNHLSGLVSNPMNEGEASKVALLTYADYLWNPSAYRPEESWQTALAHLAGEGEGYSLLRSFCEVTQSSFLWQEEAPELKEQIAAFWRAFKVGGPVLAAAIEELRHHLQDLHDLDHRLAQDFDNVHFYRDIAPYLFKLSLGAEAGKLALDLIAAYANDDAGDGEMVAELRRKTATTLANLEGIPQKMAGNLLEEFTKKTLDSTRRSS